MLVLVSEGSPNTTQAHCVGKEPYGKGHVCRISEERGKWKKPVFNLGFYYLVLQKVESVCKAEVLSAHRQQ